MFERIKYWPLSLVMSLTFGCALFVPAILSVLNEAYHMARSFFYGGLIIVILVGLISTARGQQRVRERGTYHYLREILLCYMLLPVALAIPFQEALGSISFVNAYFEMLSAMTTTGASTLSAVQSQDQVILLWRGLVAWLGGGFIWVAALYVFLPLGIGGYELRSYTVLSQIQMKTGHDSKLPRILRSVFYLYVGVTFVIWLLFLMTNIPVEVAFLRAMALVSTSGITGAHLPVLQQQLGEMISFVALLFIVTRAFLPSAVAMQKDPSDRRVYIELRLFVILIAGLGGIAVLYHLLWSYALAVPPALTDVFQLIWGQVYTFASYGASYGEVSQYWANSTDFSGQRTTYIVLLGLAAIGGGAATACGGFKLLRLYVLAIAFRQEIEQATLPNLVPRQDLVRFNLSEAAPRAAWVFVMMFLMAIALVTISFGYLGVGFEASIIFAVSALSTTGPMLEFSQEIGRDIASSSDAVKLVYCVAMLAGRFEMLAILTLFSPNLWRR